MSVTFQSSDARQSSPGNSVTFSYTVSSGSDRLLLTQGTRHDLFTSGGVTSVTYNSVSMSQVTTSSTVQDMWRLLAPTSGANNLTFNLTSYGSMLCATSDWSGVHQTTPLGSSVVATSTSSTPSTGSITCPADGAIWGSEVSQYTTGSAPTAGAGTTLAGAARSASSGRTVAGGYRLNTGALNWNLSSSAVWDAQGVPINTSGTAPPTFDVQPSDQSGVVGGTATFNCTTTGATSFQWERSEGGTNWSNISGATSEDYTTGTIVRADGGAWFRCKATNTGGTTTSNRVMLFVTDIPTSYSAAVGMVVGSSA